MTKLQNIAIPLISGLVCLTVSCKETPSVEELVCESEETISYQEKIVPILEAKCSNEGCHSNNFSAGDFTNFEGLAEKVTDGSLIEELEGNTMPPTSPLTDEELQSFICWISNGHQNN